eukprot:TRINITY_DN1310_c0_g1_i4.p1 TRINITY_DN1310_c0_g1~~TRINITY_DN1310_c0_g1_i4.p1  ORF type:complete len:164 (-),score=14.87 TRINITY_DN1310_c0_g1_i4:1208-1699(-)
MGPWLREQAAMYATARGRQVQATPPVQEKWREKCSHAANLFLSLEVDLLSEREMILLSNIVETSSALTDPSRRPLLEKLVNLIGVLHHYLLVQGRGDVDPNSECYSSLAPRRCHGMTQSGKRCKLTEESVYELHGRCAAAAEPLARGKKFCSFHQNHGLRMPS